MSAIATPTIEDFAAVQRCLSHLLVQGEVPHRVAAKFIEKSTWWIHHPQGPVRAPRHAERVSAGKYGLQLELGANKFLVEKAIVHCTEQIAAMAQIAMSSNERIDRSVVREWLAAIVHSCVADYADVMVPYGSSTDDFMHFGASAISVKDFVDELLRRTELYRILT